MRSRRISAVIGKSSAIFTLETNQQILNRLRCLNILQQNTNDSHGHVQAKRQKYNNRKSLAEHTLVGMHVERTPRLRVHQTRTHLLERERATWGRACRGRPVRQGSPWHLRDPKPSPDVAPGGLPSNLTLSRSTPPSTPSRCRAPHRALRPQPVIGRQVSPLRHVFKRCRMSARQRRTLQRKRRGSWMASRTMARPFQLSRCTWERSRWRSEPSARTLRAVPKMLKTCRPGECC